MLGVNRHLASMLYLRLHRSLPSDKIVITCLPIEILLEINIYNYLQFFSEKI